MNGYKTALLTIPILFGCEEAKDPNKIIGGYRTLIIGEGGSYPTWSPDGNDIVYVDQRDLYMVPATGGEPLQATSLTGSELYPNFNPTPGKRQVVFVQKPGSGDNGIYVVDIDNPNDIKELYVSPRDLKNPSFTFDGSEIVFQEMNTAGLRRISVDGGEPVAITNEDRWDQVNFSKASHHSNTVIYAESRTGVTNLYRISVEGGKPEPLTYFTGKEYPVFRFRAAAESYDGTRIALSISYSDPYFRYTLWTIPSSGAAEFAQISEVKDGQSGYPAWSPDGTKIAVEMGGFLYVIELAAS